MTVRPLLLALALSAASSLAQAQTIVLTHTGYLLDSGDQPLSATLPMTFGLYDAPSGGSPLWTGDAGGGAPCQVSVVAGYYAVQLGGTGPGSCGTALTSAVFGSATRHLELRINAVTLAPRQPLAAVPLASRALDADTLKGLAPDAFASAIHAHAAANNTTSGFLSAADWTTFNGKLSAETDPKVGTILAGQWCTGSSEGKVACTSAAPTGSGGQATGGVASPAACSNATAGYFWYDASVPAMTVCNGASYETLNTVTAPPGPPGAPTVTTSDGSLSVSWTIASGATSYEYEVGYQAGSVINASVTVVAVASGTTATLSGLTNGTAYAVAVRTIAGGWTSAWSAVSTGTPGTPAVAAIISTVAGNGTLGFSGDGGAAIAAGLAGPRGVAMDASGNVFLADTGNRRIRKVTPAGIISTVAGTGTAGYSGDGGAATSAQFYSPYAVAVNASGTLFVADYGNQRIRKVTSAGIVSTVAGTGTPGYSGDGGPAISAQLYWPSSVAVDASGNMFIVDTRNQRIRKVTPDGIISTVAGTGTGGFSGDGGAATSAQLYYPGGVAVDGSGNLFIADEANNRIRKVTPAGIISTVAGTGTAGYAGDGGAATSAALSDPRRVTLDGSGNLFIGDSGNHCIRKVNATTGFISTVAGTGTLGFSGDGGAASSAQLYTPFEVAVDGSGNLFIADTNNDRIRKVMP